MQTIINQIDETTFTTESRGTSYYLRFSSVLGRWELSSQRMALRAANMGGGVRFFDSLADVGNAVKAFRGIELLAEAA